MTKEKQPKKLSEAKKIAQAWLDFKPRIPLAFYLAANRAIRLKNTHNN